MTDLTESLRHMAKHHDKENFALSLEWQAALEIERLRAALEEAITIVASYSLNAADTIRITKIFESLNQQLPPDK